MISATTAADCTMRWTWASPRSKISGNTELEVRETEHFFLDMAKMNEPLLEWMEQGKEHWRPNVLNFTRGQLELRELRGRAITRDIDLGCTHSDRGL